MPDCAYCGQPAHADPSTCPYRQRRLTGEDRRRTTRVLVEAARRVLARCDEIMDGAPDAGEPDRFACSLYDELHDPLAAYDRAHNDSADDGARRTR